MLEYIKTQQFFRTRLKLGQEENKLEPVYIAPDKINSLGGLYLVNKFIASNQLVKAGNKYNVIDEDVVIDLALLDRRILPSDTLYQIMIDNLLGASLEANNKSTLYFDAFQMFKNERLDLFFTVDSFSGRVHTAVSSLNKDARPNLKLFGKPVISLDVFQMQPTLLAQTLNDHIGTNEFSEMVFNGKDVYLMIKEMFNLETRDAAKKKMFEILFGYPDSKSSFSNKDWFQWINEIKSKPLEGNTKHKVENGVISYHNNLAWLLQSLEVKVMKQIWQSLLDANIPFLTVHDEIIVQQGNEVAALELFDLVLAKEFKYYKVNVKSLDEAYQKNFDLLRSVKLPKDSSFDFNTLVKAIQNKFPKVTELDRINKAVDQMLDYGILNSIPKHNLYYTNNPF